jgi:hypothetical protein
MTITHRRLRVETLPAGARFDLTDAQWALIAPLPPVGRKPGRPPLWPRGGWSTGSDGGRGGRALAGE